MRGQNRIGLLLLRLGLHGHGFRLLADRLPVPAGFGAPGTSPLGGASPAATPDFGHMPPIHADLFASFATGGTRLVGRELVCLALFVCRPTALARDLALAVSIHGGEAAILGTWCRFHVDTDSLHPA
jgi:hypothetical protein